MQARSVNPATEICRKAGHRCRRVKGRIEKQVSTGTEADAHRSFDPQLDKTGGGERRANITPFADAMF
jgi:hypothetical protein